MKVTVFVEKQPGEKNCSCFIDGTINNCSIAGYGSTVDAAVRDLLVAREEYNDMGRAIPELDMSFKYDIWAFFDKFPVSITPLAKRIGINPSLMRQYVSGNRKPSAKRLEEIENAIHEFGKELSNVSLF
ncbi:helix-turn-helix transcriptional regulator [uncultured Prevotella sp.]|uniref:helix-turn-helix domain-containing protein n=1 Tax=uncultured Prevotella sp. TaxID=159272 RepID=UPI0026034AB5|nr:helix-turn-helix transcriptional regulator [uncultured Prevotella sp.]